jgi:hypothetical protein
MLSYQNQSELDYDHVETVITIAWNG